MKAAALVLFPVLGGVGLATHVIRRKSQFDAEQREVRQSAVSESRVRALTEAQLARICGGNAGFFHGTEFTVAGAMYSSLISGKPPRGIDIWPQSEADACKLLERIGALENAVGGKQRNGQFEVECETGECQFVEVLKTERHCGLRETVGGFDIALAAIGAHVCDGKVADVFIDARVRECIGSKQPLLAEPLPNEAFLLLTAERVLGFADDLKWPFPQPQMDSLLRRFRKQSVANKRQMIETYRHSSVDDSKRQIVLNLFEIRDEF